MKPPSENPFDPVNGPGLSHPDPTGFFTAIQMHVVTTYGSKGSWGHGRHAHETRKGPGRRRISPKIQNHPAGSKLAKRFVRDSRGENVEYRRLYTELTGKVLL